MPTVLIGPGPQDNSKHGSRVPISWMIQQCHCSPSLASIALNLYVSFSQASRWCWEHWGNGRAFALLPMGQSRLSWVFFIRGRKVVKEQEQTTSNAACENGMQWEGLGPLRRITKYFRHHCPQLYSLDFINYIPGLRYLSNPWHKIPRLKYRSDGFQERCWEMVPKRKLILFLTKMCCYI